MKVLMFRIANYNQVLKSIVVTVAVNVVDMLIRGELATKMLLHYITVFSNLFAVDTKALVSMQGLPARPEPVDSGVLREVHLGQTRSRAILSTIGSILRDVILGFAEGAYFYRTNSRSSHNAIIIQEAIA